MNPLLISRIKRTRQRLLSVFSTALLLFFLLGFFQIGRAQQAQLSLADILIGLRSKKVTLDERNKLLADAVKTRGITFALTPEIEIELDGTGASDELIEAVRQKSVKTKLASFSKPVVEPPVPTSAPTVSPDFAFYRKRGDESYIKGEFESALSDYGKALEMNPKDSATYLNRGRAYLNQKSYDLAMLDFNRTIELDSNDATAYLSRADVFEKKNEIQKAIADYQKAVELNAKNQTAKNNLKRLQDEQAKIEQTKLELAKIEQEKAAAKLKTAEKPIVAETPKAVETSNSPLADKSKTVELGQLNNLALKLAKPIYSPLAQKMNAQGKVTVQVTIDEQGKVISAKAVDGHSLLRGDAENAARSSKFKPALDGNQPIKATGFIIYNFVAP